MSRYLEEAAEVLRKAAESNDKSPSHDRRVEIAREFATLAAIDKGLLPAEVIEEVLRSIAARS